jgi:hypothetical protein
MSLSVFLYLRPITGLGKSAADAIYLAQINQLWKTLFPYRQGHQLANLNQLTDAN